LFLFAGHERNRGRSLGLPGENRTQGSTRASLRAKVFRASDTSGTGREGCASYASRSATRSRASSARAGDPATNSASAGEPGDGEIWGQPGTDFG
ncbi:MAG: hypothetical protein ABSD20_20875, partial [Terriglobales bacterium]